MFSNIPFMISFTIKNQTRKCTILPTEIFSHFIIVVSFYPLQLLTLPKIVAPNTYLGFPFYFLQLLPEPKSVFFSDFIKWHNFGFDPIGKKNLHDYDILNAAEILISFFDTS